MGGPADLKDPLWGVIVFGVRFDSSYVAATALAVAATTTEMGACRLLVTALFVEARKAESMASPMIAPL